MNHRYISNRSHWSSYFKSNIISGSNLDLANGSHNTYMDIRLEVTDDRMAVDPQETSGNILPIFCSLLFAA